MAVVSRPGSPLGRLAGKTDQISVYRLNMTDAVALKTCLVETRPEVIFHTSAQTRFSAENSASNWCESIVENISGLINLVSLASTSKSPPRVLVRTASIAEYGDIEIPYVETAEASPRNAYGASMLAGTQYLTATQPFLPFPAVSARLALTYGPDQSDNFFVPHLIKRLLSHQPVTINRPHDHRDLVHVGDVVRSLMMIADNPAPAGSVVNVCSGKALSMGEVARILAGVTGAPKELIRPMPAVDAPTVLVSDPGRFVAAYGWAPDTPLLEGLERTVKWSRQNHGSVPAEREK